MKEALSCLELVSLPCHAGERVGNSGGLRLTHSLTRPKCPNTFVAASWLPPAGIVELEGRACSRIRAGKSGLQMFPSRCNLVLAPSLALLHIPHCVFITCGHCRLATTD